jgi:hypothetical protein
VIFELHSHNRIALHRALIRMHIVGVINNVLTDFLVAPRKLISAAATPFDDSLLLGGSRLAVQPSPGTLELRFISSSAALGRALSGTSGQYGCW